MLRHGPVRRDRLGTASRRYDLVAGPVGAVPPLGGVRLSGNLSYSVAMPYTANSTRLGSSSSPAVRVLRGVPAPTPGAGPTGPIAGAGAPPAGRLAGGRRSSVR